MNIKRYYIFFPVVFYLTGSIAILAAEAIASIVSELPDSLTNARPYYILLMISTWGLILTFTKDYKIGRAEHYGDTFLKSLKSIAIFISACLFLMVFFNFGLDQRKSVGLFFLFSLVSISSAHVLLHHAIILYRKKGFNYRNAIIIGYDKISFSLYDTLINQRDHGIKCKGFYTEDSTVDVKYPVLGKVSEVLRESWEKIDFVYISGNLDNSIINRVIERADNEFVKVKLLPDFVALQPKQYRLKQFNHLSIIDVNDLPLDSLFNRSIKRGFDIIFSSIVILFILSWLYPLIALLIKIESSGKVVFVQRRHGKDNQVFNCYKFRTMVENDDADSKWATVDDPRITKVGRFLRKTSMDELPQFFNVFLGEMTIVGPRPHALEMNEFYKDKVEKFAQRHTYKPGITGLAQSMGYRGEIKELYHIKSRVKLDRFYLQNWTFFFDIKIILKTVWVLMRGQETAY